MQTVPDRLTEIRRHLDKAVSFNDLARHDWRRQTDVVKEAFAGAALFVNLGENAILVDGRISDRHKMKALAFKGGVKSYFNARFHDAGFKWRRLVMFDTIETRKMGRRASGRHKLHFHGIVELPPSWSKAALKRLLAKVFGTAGAMGERQFHISEPRWDQHHTFNGVQVTGPLGKLMYAIDHAGSTYTSLDLNNGKRSRSAPACRRVCNRAAAGLAKGIPSNFNAKIVLCDTASKQAGRRAFELWVRAEKASQRVVPARQDERMLRKASPSA